MAFGRGRRLGDTLPEPAINRSRCGGDGTPALLTSGAWRALMHECLRTSAARGIFRVPDRSKEGRHA